MGEKAREKQALPERRRKMRLGEVIELRPGSGLAKCKKINFTLISNHRRASRLNSSREK